jgi:hypothetical protein
MGEMNAYKILVGKPEGKRLGRPRCRQEDKIAMDLTEIGRGSIDFTDLAQVREQ